METIKFTINTAPRTKKGNGQIIHIGQRHVMLPSKAFQQFSKICKQILPKDLFNLNIDEPVNIKYLFYCDARRKCDLANLIEAVDDIFADKEVKIILDDNRNIIAAHDGSRVYYDKENPRIEVEITPLNEEYEVWGNGRK